MHPARGTRAGTRDGGAPPPLALGGVPDVGAGLPYAGSPRSWLAALAS
ncbi:hypothetical protein [Cellulosimicrobium sp. Marseille-Q4280]|nr:hypothetical protein [Cellulosimicrobium sp. Marseille-Q4280]